MRKLFSILFFVTLVTGYSQDNPWMTYYEKSGFVKTPRYKETMEYCRELVSASNLIQLHPFGESAQGRLLPLLIIDKEGFSSPEKIRAAGRIILLIQACIHPGESEGKDAGLMLVRDIVLKKKYPGLLDHVSILFIPIFNVDGHERFGPYNRINQNGPEEMGWRVTSTNLNLNRDFLKADAPEMQNWLRMYNKWLPEFFIDIHTTDGADYQYVLTYYIDTYGGMESNLTDWSKGVFIKEWTSQLEKSGYPVFPYVEFREWHNPQSGLTTGVAPPMLSQGYTTLKNRPGLLIETHMLKPYRQRVTATYESLVIALNILNKEYQILEELVNKADTLTASDEFRTKKFPLSFKTVMTDSTMIDFKGIRYSKINSELTGDAWYKYGTAKETMSIPLFDKTEPKDLVQLPEAYIIPVEWRSIIERLRIHGIRMYKIKKDTLLTVSTYRLSNPQWQVFPYEGRHRLTNFNYEEIQVTRLFSAGSVVIAIRQPSARLIAEILEPKGEGSYLSWGFFDAVFEQKEYAERYLMEERARKMLAEDPKLNEEFLAKKQQDPAFAKNSFAILNWFYSKTPYWDSRKDVYPIGRITDRKTVEELLRR